MPAPGAWIEAEKAFYVVGSSKMGSMGEKEAVPFAKQEAAAQFAVQYGGEVLDFEATKKAMSTDQAGS